MKLLVYTVLGMLNSAYPEKFFGMLSKKLE